MKRTLIAALFALATTALPAQAGQLLDVSVVDRDDGTTLPLYRDGGRWYVAGEPGHRYAVVLRNNTAERVMAVLSVDGVNAISGQTAGTQQSGYVLSPWQQTEVRGWRKNMSETAEFYFTSVPDSYAARTGRAQNVGVIGVAVYRERVYLPPPPVIISEGEMQRPYDRAAGAASDSAAPRASPSAPLGIAGNEAKRARSAEPSTRQELGTGHGERRYDPARYTTFQRRGSRPDEVVTLYYDSHEALVDRGVIPDYRWSRRRDPEPFPNGFAPDPY